MAVEKDIVVGNQIIGLSNVISVTNVIADPCLFGSKSVNGHQKADFCNVSKRAKQTHRVPERMPQL